MCYYTRADCGIVWLNLETKETICCGAIPINCYTDKKSLIGHCNNNYCFLGGFFKIMKVSWRRHGLDTACTHIHHSPGTHTHTHTHLHVHTQPINTLFPWLSKTLPIYYLKTDWGNISSLKKHDAQNKQPKMDITRLINTAPGIICDQIERGKTCFLAGKKA